MEIVPVVVIGLGVAVIPVPAAMLVTVPVLPADAVNNPVADVYPVRNSPATGANDCAN
jgi:hypothetical protein